MELYRKYPKLTVAWCCLEIILYSGQLFGWSSLLYVLKQEGFYKDICEFQFKTQNESMLTDDEIQGRNKSNAIKLLPVSYFTVSQENASAFPTEIQTNTSAKHAFSYDVFEYKAGNNHSNETRLLQTATEYNENWDADTSEGCFAQDARLNLWFSVAVSTTYLMCAFFGPLVRLTGMRSFRLSFM